MSAAPLTALTVGDLKDWLRVTAARIAENADELTELDAAIGDADHGANMRRGMAAVVAAIDPMESDRGRTIVVDRLERKERRRAPRK